ncbi:glutathione S-transferase-like [Olea europaea var. sylvestris]|uniref:glutathione S-transferase-like n=1 Tax=Olea europaea var. sylvestris TaxID=158386 RepID=UPI000C1CD7C6|nr:glutathione S-transferase-like [Olea europaea var. sylvestris]
MAIKVHGLPFSIATQRVLVTLAEKELDYEFVYIDLATGQQKTEDFVKLHPFGQVPVLEDGDLTLFESRAIAQYIAHTYADKGNPLITSNPKKMAILSVWTEVEAQRFDPQAYKLAYELVIKPILGRTTDEAIVTEHEGKLAEVLDVYEAHLTQSKYLGGDSFTLADLHHLPVINYLMGSKIKALFDARPHVSAWCADILARPAWQKIIALMKH